MSSQVHSSSWSSEKSKFIPQSVVNFLARRRIAISLIGFTSLALINVFVRWTVPLNPFQLSNPLVAVAVSLLLIGLAIRSWSAGTLNKSRELTTTGPYAMNRNPLYLGSFLMMFGFCILCRDWPTLLFVAGPMAFLYRLQILFEEQRLARLFPSEWPNYQQTVPRLWVRLPSLAAFRGWTTMEWLRNREYRTLAASVFGIGAVYLWHWYQTGA